MLTNAVLSAIPEHCERRTFMHKLIILFLILSCTACSYFPGVHKIDIDQGNIVTQEMVDQLRPGMTKEQVRFVMGSPLVMDTFDQSRWDYLLTNEHNGSERTIERMNLFFTKGKLSSFSGDFRPSPPKEPTTTSKNDL